MEYVFTNHISITSYLEISYVTNHISIMFSLIIFPLRPYSINTTTAFYVVTECSDVTVFV